MMLLREQDGKHRLLPIYIGTPEASAIHYALEGVQPPRPLTHDLFLVTLGELGASVTKIVVTATTSKISSTPSALKTSKPDRLSPNGHPIVNESRESAATPPANSQSMVDRWVKGA
jgi:hypothetical protein